jgi:signal transduction histidine kinase
MTPEPDVIGNQPKIPMLEGCQIQEHSGAGETGLLLQAFEMFTQASNSLESAFGQLQLQVQRLTEELEAKNLELEQSLREKEEAQSYLRTILERLPCGVVVLDQNGDLALCNPMATEALKQSRGSSKRPQKSGRTVLSAEMRKCLTSSVSDSGNNGEVEISVVNNDKKRILATSGTPFADAGGHRIGTLHIIRDITEFKALQEKGKRDERLSAMGEMAVELAHEIRNPLGSVELFTSLLVKELSGDPKRWAENIRIGIRTLNTIVSNMLHFANPISPAFTEVNVNEIIEELLRFTEPIMRQREVRIEKNLGAENPTMLADPELLKQMMLNLIFNAMKAMPSQGALTINTRNIESQNGDCRSSELELQIRDTGIGILPENLSRIFDPFFTTNKNGTGLGLSVVHQIVEKHSGRICVSSEVNRGTVFTILFGSKSGKE